MKYSISFLLLFFYIFIFGQNRPLWNETSLESIPEEDIIQYSGEVKNTRFYSLNKSAVTTFLSHAPDRFANSSSSVVLNIPNPNGIMESFEMFSTQTLPSNTSVDQQIYSYVGTNKENKSHRLRITITPYGFYGMTIGSKFGQTFINPYANNSDVYMIFQKNQVEDFDLRDHVCEFVQDEEEDHEHISDGDSQSSNLIQDGILRRYRLGVATTVEYSEFHWTSAGIPSSASDAIKKNAVQAAIVVSIDRVNEIYERDFGVTFQLIPNNTDVIYIGASNSDPYSNNNGGAMLSQNQTVFNTVIGSANYDIGHVFSTGGGGIASLGSVCSNSFKARGVTGQGAPVGDVFDIDFVAHEIGHQFGGNHTQNNNCQRNGPTAVEPGSANTIMGYAGICSPNTQNNSDAMFHYISIVEVSDFIINDGGSNCFETINTSNVEPIIQNIPNYTIPRNTPLALTASATDADGDVLTYSWEQYDNEIAQMPPQANATGGPSFRTFLPSNNPTRYLPGLGTLLNNNYTNTWEVLPNATRTLDFAVVVRDNNSSGGQVSTETTRLTVDASAGPFRVTSQQGSSVTWASGNSVPITWNVANTDNASGVNSPLVDIFLSTDNGQNFDTPLALNTPNDGSHTIVVPNTIVQNARFIVKSSNNIFFDINEADIEIVSGSNCQLPSNLNLNNVDISTADISWDASPSSPSSGYDYFLTDNGTVPDNSTMATGNVSAGVTSLVLNNLQADTSYEFYLRSDCGSGSVSAWTLPISFSTLCNSILAPYFENFDGSDWGTGASEGIADCWTRNPNDIINAYAWRVSTGATPSNDSGPLFDSSTNGNYLYPEASGFSTGDAAQLDTPTVDLSNLESPTLSFFYHMYGSNMGTLNVEVKNINDINYTIVETISGQQQNSATANYLYRSISLDAFIGETINIRFTAIRGNGFNSDIAIDELLIDEFDYCTASGDGAPDSADFEKIDSVVFNTINNQSNSNGGYQDFRSIYTPVQRGTTYTLTVESPDISFSTDLVVAWVDFNQDGDFDDATEQVFISNVGESPWSDAFSIPNTALLGETTMRIRLFDSDSQFLPNITPCGFSGYGEVEDYTLVIYDDYIYYDNTWTPVSPSGVSTSADNILVVNGSPTLDGTTLADVLTILPNSTLNIGGIIGVDSEIKNDGELIFRSNSSSTGQFDSFSGNISGSGLVGVERYLPAGDNNNRAYRFLSSAVSSTRSIYDNWQQSGLNPSDSGYISNFGTHITGDINGNDGFDATASGNPSAFTFNNAFVATGNESQFNAYTVLPNTNVLTVDAGIGYSILIRGDRSIDLTSNTSPPTNTTLRTMGDMFIGTFEYNSTNNNSNSKLGLSEIAGYYNLIGNPYQAIVDYNNLTLNNINPLFYWVWDANIGSRGQYVSVIAPTGINNSGSPANQFIQPGQSFFVQTSANGSSSLVFDEADKTVTANETSIFSETVNPSIKMLLYQTNNLIAGKRESDGVLIQFHENGNNAKDAFDADKLGNASEMLAIDINNNLISIENRDLPTETDIIQLYANNYEATQYTFKINSYNILGNFDAYVVDHYSGIQTKINEGITQIDFTVDETHPESLSEDRFTIMFDNVTLGNENNFLNNDIVLFPNPMSRGKFYISGFNSDGLVNVEIVNIMGQTIINEQFLSIDHKVEIRTPYLPTGTYIVKLVQNDSYYYKKLIVE